MATEFMEVQRDALRTGGLGELFEFVELGG
jgi:hypothetical protein